MWSAAGRRSWREQLPWIIGPFARPTGGARWMCHRAKYQVFLRKFCILTNVERSWEAELTRAVAMDHRSICEAQGRCPLDVPPSEIPSIPKVVCWSYNVRFYIQQRCGRDKLIAQKQFVDNKLSDTELMGLKGSEWYSLPGAEGINILLKSNSLINWVERSWWN